MDVPSLKYTNPQKYHVKIICSGMYYLGFGTCWYEQEKITWYYLVWAAVSNFYTFAVFFSAFLANIRSDLDDMERNDVVQFTFAYASIAGKIILNYVYRKDIKIMLERLLERRFAFVSVELDKACVKRFAVLCIMLVGASYATLFATIADGIRIYFQKGLPIRFAVVYFPTSSETGIIVNILRFLIIFHWFYSVAIMAVIDCLCICSLVIVGYKLKTLQAYFESLRVRVLEGRRNRRVEEQFIGDFVVGIKMHEDALWCAKSVQSALGNLYSVQVIEQVLLLLMCLIKLVTVERNLVVLLANFTFILCLVLITGAYMVPGGDLTHEASVVSSAMYHSGWEVVGSRRDIRVLLVIALQRSQVPVAMYALGILELSYSNYISVIRSSYSFFAVMY